MRLPSLDQIAAGAGAALLRFPGPLIAALLATVAAFRWIGDRGAGEEPALRLIASALLAMPLGVAGTVGFERRYGESAASRLGGLLVGTLVIPVFWFGFPRWTEALQASRFVHLAILFHLSVAFVPFLGRREPNAFWQFNRRIFERWLLGVVYAAALFVGLSLALLALDQLFGFDVPDRTYARLWATMAFLFHPLFFLAGVPRHLETLELDRDWPGGLRAFARFVLVPLTTIYLLILTAYFVKVAGTGSWPSGWIGWLVSGAASVGILTLLLSGPPATRHEAPWASLFERWFWPAVLPAALMLLLAIWKRIDQYGITERRYFLAVLAVWLLGVAVAFTVRRRLDLIVIPVSLAILAALIFAGPWGAYQSARRSQYARLETVLQSAGALRGGTLTRVAENTDGEAAREAAREAANIVAYLVRTHGANRMMDWLAEREFTVRDLPRDSTSFGRAHAQPFVTALGLQGWEGRGERRYLWAHREAVAAVEVTGFDLLVPIRHRSPGDTLWPAGDTVSAWLGLDRRSVEIRRGGLLLTTIGLDQAIDSLATWRLRTPSGAPPPDALLSVSEPDGSARLHIRQIGIRDSLGVWRAEQLEGEVLLRRVEGGRRESKGVEVR